MSSARCMWFFAACAGIGCRAAPAVAAPDLIVVNADVYTEDADRPRVEAFAVEGGKFSALGSDDEIRAFGRGQHSDPGCQRQDCHARVHRCTPALWWRQQPAQSLLWSREEWARLIRAEHERLPKGAWLTGGRDHTIIDDVLPTKEFLDEIVGDRPVVLRHIDGHFVWVNSAMLRLAGITADTPVPPGGEIVVDPSTREPTGILKEGAAQLIARVPQPQLTEAERSSRLPAALHWANSFGITGMHNMAGIDDVLDVLENGDLTVRIWHGYFGFRGDNSNLDQRVAEVVEIKESVRKRVEATHKEELVGPLFKLGFVRLINDGVLSIHTAVLLDDYEDMPGWHGEFSSTPEDLKLTVRKPAEAGFQVAIHSIGDAAVRASLDAYEAAAQFHVGLPRHGEQAVTFAEALHAYTLGPAETTEWADQIGSISVGKWADFVIVDRKIPEPADRSLFEASVEATYFAGREVLSEALRPKDLIDLPSVVSAPA